MESNRHSEMNSHLYGKLSYDKEGRTYNGGKRDFNKWPWEN